MHVLLIYSLSQQHLHDHLVQAGNCARGPAVSPRPAPRGAESTQRGRQQRIHTQTRNSPEKDVVQRVRVVGGILGGDDVWAETWRARRRQPWVSGWSISAEGPPVPSPGGRSTRRDRKAEIRGGAGAGPAGPRAWACGRGVMPPQAGPGLVSSGCVISFRF